MVDATFSTISMVISSKFLESTSPQFVQLVEALMVSFGMASKLFWAIFFLCLFFFWKLNLTGGSGWIMKILLILSFMVELFSKKLNLFWVNFSLFILVLFSCWLLFLPWGVAELHKWWEYVFIEMGGGWKR